jgi:sporulation delaying protein SdpA
MLSVILCSAYMFFFALIFVSYLSFSPATTSIKLKKYFQVFSSQGLSFFKSKPNQLTINIYVVENSAFKNIYCKSGDMRIVFGAQSSTYMQMAEVGLMLKQIPDSLWLKNQGELTNNTTQILDELMPFELENKSKFKSLKGPLVIEKIDPKTRIWSPNNAPIKTPSAFVYLNVA